ncbi:hypothetical protein [Evansella cellulosilytica]|nr:hypothetical protein [Evansella cellulosilytica]
MGKSTEEKMLEYLEETYNEEFEIEFVNKGGGGLFSSSSSSENAVAHLKSNPDIVFTIRENKNKTSFNDSYLLARWGKELEDKLQLKASEHLPDNSEYRITLRATPDKYDSSMVNKSVDDFILHSDGDVTVTLVVAIKTNEKPSVSEYSEEIYHLYELIKDVSSKRYAVSVGFVDEKDDISNYMTNVFVNNIGWDNLNAKVYGVLNLNNTQNVSNYESVIDYFRQIEE